MPRPLRTDVGGYAYHVLNRTNARTTIFETDHDYRAFETVLTEARVEARGGLIASLHSLASGRQRAHRGGHALKDRKTVPDTVYRLHPFSRENLKKYFTTIKSPPRELWMFNYVGMHQLPYFVLYRK